MTKEEFVALAAQGYNRIPLMVEAFADLETPLSLYLKLAFAKDQGKYSFLLESVVGGERFGRYSFIGLPARTLLRASGFGADAVTQVVTDGMVVETSQQNPAWQVILATTRCATSKKSLKNHAHLIRWAALTFCCCNAKNWR